jgi:hypothetical protein
MPCDGSGAGGGGQGCGCHVLTPIPVPCVRAWRGRRGGGRRRARRAHRELLAHASRRRHARVRRVARGRGQPAGRASRVDHAAAFGRVSPDVSGLRAARRAGRWRAGRASPAGGRSCVSSSWPSGAVCRAPESRRVGAVAPGRRRKLVTTRPVDRAALVPSGRGVGRCALCVGVLAADEREAGEQPWPPAACGGSSQRPRRYGSGSIGRPAMRSSKCRCGP